MAVATTTSRPPSSRTEVSALEGALQTEELIPEWQRAWDELTDLKLDGEGVDSDMDTDAMI